jgi:hypothetical protein
MSASALNNDEIKMKGKKGVATDACGSWLLM